jgi:ATP-binding cassette subfamily F protein uup
MADPAFYRKTGGEIAEARAQFEALELELASAYRRWEELEALGG